MIITRSPLRISLGGGGTDLPSYYKKHSGFLIAAAIDKFVYITVHQTFVPDLIVKYSAARARPHRVGTTSPDHPRGDELVGLDGQYLERPAWRDIPAGTGLGSSGSFTTALLKALHALEEESDPPTGARQSRRTIEIDLLKEPIGSRTSTSPPTRRGLTRFQFLLNGNVEATLLKVDSETLYNLQDNLLLFFTGYSRRREHPQGTGSEEPHERQGDDRQPPLRGRSWRQSQEASQRPHQVRRADERPLEHKKKPPAACPIRHRPLVPARHGKRALRRKVIAPAAGFLMFYAEDKTSRHALHAGRFARCGSVRFRGTKIVIQ